MPSEKRLLRWILFVVALAFLPIILDLSIELYRQGTIDWGGILRHTDILIVILVVSIEAASDLVLRRVNARWESTALAAFFVCIIVSLIAAVVFTLTKLSPVVGADGGVTAGLPPSLTSPTPTITSIPRIGGAETNNLVSALTADDVSIAILFLVLIAFCASLCCKIAAGQDTSTPNDNGLIPQANS